MAKMLKKHIVIIGSMSMILFYAPVLFLNQGVMLSLTKEDGFYESVGALLFFFASMVFLYTFVKAKKRNFYFLLFALAFFFAAGEEISWGQRIFNFDTPAALEASNAQKEFTIHNLDYLQHEEGIGSSIKGFLFNFNRLFMLFWTVYCIFIPLADKYSIKLRKLFLQIHLPVVSIWFGMLFILNEIMSKTLELFVVICQSDCPKIYEIKESLWALLVLLWAVYFYFKEASNKDTLRNSATSHVP